ncbi:unnamed protein product, partial [Iphiclides podalirius]
MRRGSRDVGHRGGGAGKRVAGRVREEGKMVKGWSHGDGSEKERESEWQKVEGKTLFQSEAPQRGKKESTSFE